MKKDLKTLASLVSEPIFFESNRVGRVYKGGKLFADFFGDDGEDNFLPEEWVGSYVKALNKGSTDPKEGVSKIKFNDEYIYFDDLLLSHKNELIGERNELGILVKMLDSAIRLPVQVHPNKGFSRKHFNSNHGKAESWVVVAIREGAKVYLGFNQKIGPAELEEAILASLEKKDGYSAILNEVAVKPGDCFFISPNTIHAIGAGCLILEVQEPTDFTISTEYYCGDYKLTQDEMYLGLEKELALSNFDFNNYGKNILEKSTITPKTIKETNGIKIESIINKSTTDCFALNKITINQNQTTLTAEAAIYIVTSGEGEILGENYQKSIKKGSYFFLPKIAANKFSIKSQNIEIYECLPI